MSNFWLLARAMLRHRWAIIGAVAMATLSAVSLSSGLVASKPVVEMIFGEGKPLVDHARDLNASLAKSRLALVRQLRIPDALIDHLPTTQEGSLLWVFALIGLATLFSSLGYFVHQVVTLSVVNRTLAELRHRVFHAVLRAPLARAVRGGSADAVSRIINDTGVLANGFLLVLSKSMIQAFKGVAGLAAALFFDWRTTVAALVFVPAFYTIIRKVGKRIRRASGAALAAQGRLQGVATQALQALKVVKVSTAEPVEAGRFHRANKAVLHDLQRARTARALASPLTEFLNVLLFVAILLLVMKLAARGIVDKGDLMLAVMGLGIAGASFKPIVGIIADIQGAAPAADRVAELLHAEPEPGHGAGRPPLPAHHRSIELRSVTFTYPGATAPALRDVSLLIPHGQRIAIVGPNGSGKTTLLALVPRLYDPDAGAVLIDGVDIRDVAVRSLRAQVGVVTQETVLFADTIRHNIAYAAEHASDERVLDAARRARADDFIRQLPQGYDTPVAEQGLSLSGGQRQRIAIARAILRDPAILILDEATSMIDTESERAISDALAEFSRGRTCLIVAHRLSTIVNADRIVVMDAGRIIDQGLHAELLARCDTYRRLVSSVAG